MAHFAKVKNNVVVDLIVISNDNCGGGVFPKSEPIGQAFIAKLAKEDSRFKGAWYQTSYNTKNGLYFKGNPIYALDEESQKLVPINGELKGAFRFHFGQIGCIFDPSAGEHGEFYPPEINE
jgi:hypothetical protein